MQGLPGVLGRCAEQGIDTDLSPANVSGYLTNVLVFARQSTTARERRLGPRRVSTWLPDEGEVDTDPPAWLKRPKLDNKIIHPLAPAQIEALLRA
ncbi:hypothetical protein [Demequina sp.]|uniref:hypothetical protein n=1 Tax=Demequina sp. TaxID=2050685 RepID=UPI003A8A3B7D